MKPTADDIQSDVWKGLDLTTAEDYRDRRSVVPRNKGLVATPRKGRSTVGVKRSSNQTDTSPAALLRELEGCIEGHESLRS